jgi:dihydroorotase
LLIRSGHVIDPASGIDARRDVAIAAGRVAAVDQHIEVSSAAQAIDAEGLYVTPGLVDLHAHVYRDVTYWGVDADAIGSTSGVTTWIDVGSAGAMTLAGLRERVARPSQVRIYALLNISYIGLVGPDYEVANLRYCDLDLFNRSVAESLDFVRGVKVRIGTPTVGENGVEPLRIAREAADRWEFPLMVHIADAPPGVDEVLPYLRSGDVITHCFTGASMKIVDDRGRLRDDVKRVWDAGVVMDIGHGGGSLSFETAEAALAEGYRPDTISTDLHQMSLHGPAVLSSDVDASPIIRVAGDGQPQFDLPTCMSKFLALGMTLADVVRAATVRPAEVVGLAESIGTLRPGAAADIALFALEEGSYMFHDVYGGTRQGRLQLRNRLTLVGGRQLEPRPHPPPPPWVELVDRSTATVEH